MTVSLTLYDRRGRLIFDGASSPIRVIGEFTTGTSNGRIVDDRLYGGRPFVFPVRFSHNIEDEDDNDKYYTTTGIIPVLTLSGNTISWEFITRGGGYRLGHNSVTFKYGVYFT